MRYDALLFDFDGVLADTEPVHCACWAEAIRPFGLELDWETYRQIGIGSSDRDLVEFLARRAGPPVTPEQLLARHPEKQRLFAARMMTDPPIPGAVKSYVKSLTERKLAVVTSSFKAEIDPVLVRAGIRSCFAALVAGDEVSNLKPAPHPYLLAAKLLGAKSPLAIEDSDAGVASARAAGFDVLRLAGPHELPSNLAAALNGS
jgi:HAD superfamily hydrolase (TIGR01509 family)